MRQAFAVVLLALLLASCAGGSGSSGTIKSDPENSFAHYYNLGLAAFEQKNYQEAIRHFQRSVELNPNISRTHVELGTSYLFVGNNQGAASAFERALELDPRMIEAHNSLGIAYLNLGRFNEAQQQFNALLNEPEYSTPFIPLYNLGNLYFQRKNYQQALLYYNEALKEETKITPDYRLAVRRQLGHVQYELGDYEKAFNEYGRVLVISPRDLVAAFQSGMCAMKLGRNDDARQMFTKVLTIDPDSQQAQEARQHLNQLNN